MKLRLLSLFCLIFLARASENDEMVVMKVIGADDAYAELTNEHLKYIPYLADILEQQHQGDVVYPFEWNNGKIHAGDLNYYAPGSTVDKMFFFLKNIAPAYNSDHEVPKPLTTSFDNIKMQAHLARNKFIDERKRELIANPKPEMEMPASEQTKWTEKANSAENTEGKSAQALWWAQYEEKAAAYNKKLAERKAEENNDVESANEPNKTDKECWIEDQLKAYKKVLDKEKVKQPDFATLWTNLNDMPREAQKENDANNEHVNPKWEHAKIVEENIKAAVIDFFRFEVKGAANVFAATEDQREHLIEAVIANRQRQRDDLVAQFLLKVEEDETDKKAKDSNYKPLSDKEKEEKATQMALVNVAGEYGHDALEVTDCQLNEVSPAGVKDEISELLLTPETFQIKRENKVNNPVELLNMIEVANGASFDVLLMFSAAKLASLIRQNDLYRLRAMLGFNPTGDYTWESYEKDGEVVIGFNQLVKDNSWFNVDSKTEDYHLAAEHDRANGKCMCRTTPNGDKFRVNDDDYKKNGYPTGTQVLSLEDARAKADAPKARKSSKEENKIVDIVDENKIVDIVDDNKIVDIVDDNVNQQNRLLTVEQEYEQSQLNQIIQNEQSQINVDQDINQIVEQYGQSMDDVHKID